MKAARAAFTSLPRQDLRCRPAGRPWAEPPASLPHFPVMEPAVGTGSSPFPRARAVFRARRALPGRRIPCLGVRRAGIAPPLVVLRPVPARGGGRRLPRAPRPGRESARSGSLAFSKRRRRRAPMGEPCLAASVPGEFSVALGPPPPPGVLLRGVCRDAEVGTGTRPLPVFFSEVTPLFLRDRPDGRWSWRGGPRGSAGGFPPRASRSVGPGQPRCVRSGRVGCRACSRTQGVPGLL